MSKAFEKIKTGLVEAIKMTEVMRENDRLRTELAAVTKERDMMLEALIDTTASLVASVSLLERGGKKAAPSNTMFAQMLVDYKNSIDRARAAIKGVKEPANTQTGER